MSLEYYFRDPATGNTTQLDDDRVRLYTLSVTANAEEGSIGVSEVTIDDPDGDFNIGGHRVFAVKETEISASSNTFVYVGYTGERTISRGPYRNGAGSQWRVQLTDINTVFDRRVMVGSDCNRPAETDVARVQWLEATAEGALIDDTRYLSTANPVQMDAVDYRGQTFKDVIDDCAQQSGKNYYLTYFGDVGVSPWGEFSLWYGDAGSTDYSSTIRLSNDLADVDSVTTFAVSIDDTELTRDPSRVYSGVYMPYDGGTAYVQNAATANAFARRDAVSPAENVKTAARANARAARYLADIDTEEDVIKTSFQVPAAYVNHAREGMRIEAKFTHLPGYEDFEWMRILNRNVVQDSELTYTITVELSASPNPATANGPSEVAHAVLYQPGETAVASEVIWVDTGDPTPGAGCATVPTTGGLSVPEPPPYAGINVLRPGRLDFHFRTSVSMVCADETVTATFVVRRSGVVVGTITGTPQTFTFPGGFGDDQTVTGTTDVSAGDLIDAQVVLTSSRRGIMVADAIPIGTVNCAFKLEVSGFTAAP